MSLAALADCTTSGKPPPAVSLDQPVKAEPLPALSAPLGVSSELAVSNQSGANGNVVIAPRGSTQNATNQVGREITRRNLSIQPTLTVWPGFAMEVMVNKDLVLWP